MFEDCQLNRIDAHAGFYDVTIRDCHIGAEGLTLTGQGPLTIERTDVHAGNLINVRADYGSTWDGDAHIIDSAYYHLTQPGQQTQSMFAVTASFDDREKTKLHDFGYETHHPNLYFKNFTYDVSGVDLGVSSHLKTCGIISNWVNGLEKLPASYWPAAVQFEGFNVTGYNESLGYEGHLRMPLQMVEPVAGLLAQYGMVSPTFEGGAISANLDDTSLVKKMLSNTPVIARRGNGLKIEPFTFDRLGDDDIVMEYTGNEPSLCFADRWASNDTWIAVAPYFVEHRDGVEVGYFSNAEIKKLWEQKQAQHPSLGAVGVMHVQPEDVNVDGGPTTCLLRVAVFDTHAWGAPTYTWSDDLSHVTATRAKVADPATIETETVPTTHLRVRDDTATGEQRITYLANFSNPGFVRQAKTVASEMPTPPAAVTVTGITAKDKTYDGTTNAELDFSGAKLTTDGTEVTGNVSVTATGAFADANAGKDKEVSIANLTLVGDDADQYVLAETSQQATTTANIVPKEVGLAWSGTTFVYDGSPHVPGVTLNDLVDGDECVATVAPVGSTAVDAGAYTAAATSLAGRNASNYRLPEGETATTTFSIAKAANPITTTAAAMVRPGETTQLGTRVTGASGTVSWAIQGDALGCTVDAVTGAFRASTTTGSVHVAATAAGDENHEPGATDVQVDITKKQTRELEVTLPGVTYGEKLAAPGYTLPEGAGEPNVTYAGTLRRGGAYGPIVDAPSEAGSYTVTVTCETKDVIYTGTCTFKIEPANIAGATVALGPELIFDGTPQTQTVASVTLRGEDVLDSCDVSDNEATEAGTHTLTVTAREASNYTGSVTADYTIREDAPAPPAGTATNATKDRAPNNWGDANLTSTANELATAVGVDAGQDAEVWLQTSEEVSDEERAAVIAAAGDHTVAHVFDARLFMSIDGEVSELHELAAAIGVSVVLPEGMPAAEPGATRSWFLVRVHEGETALLPAIYDATSNRLSFFSDRFSTYAVAYRDVLANDPSANVEDPNDDPTAAQPAGPSANKTSGAAVNTQSHAGSSLAHTGDTSPSPYGVTIIAGFVLLAGILVERRLS